MITKEQHPQIYRELIYKAQTFLGYKKERAKEIEKMHKYIAELEEKNEREYQFLLELKQQIGDKEFERLIKFK